MGWTCRRPGCNHTAVATIGYDAVSCQLWLDAIDDRFPPAQALCQQHAEGLRAPRGWVVVDRRRDQTAIVTTPPAPSSTPAPTVERRPGRAAPSRPPRRGSRGEAPRLDFDAAERAAVPPIPPPEPQTAASVESGAPIESEREPDRVPVDDLTALLEPKGRLLGRAFASTGAQRSAIPPGPVDTDVSADRDQ